MNRQCSRIEGAQRGMALLECLMALLIFSVGLLGLLGLEARVMNISTDSENRNRAAMLASEVASAMWLNNTVLPTAPAVVASNAPRQYTQVGAAPFVSAISTSSDAQAASADAATFTA